jgi:hypothetical protein
MGRSSISYGAHGLRSGEQWAKIRISHWLRLCCLLSLPTLIYLVSSITRNLGFPSWLPRTDKTRTAGVILSIHPCGGGVEYLHRDPASFRRRRKEKSRIWDSKIWPRVLRDSYLKVTALSRASSNCKRQTRPFVREGAPNQQTRNCQTIIKIWS